MGKVPGKMPTLVCITSKKPGTILSMQNVDGVNGPGSNREPLGQTKVMKIHQGAITHEICCLSRQFVLIENRTKPGTILSETVLSGDPLYSRTLFFSLHNKVTKS